MSNSFFFVFFLLVSSGFLFFLEKINFIQEFKPNSLGSFIEYIFIGLFLLNSFSLFEILLSVKKNGHVMKLLDEKEIYIRPSFLKLKVKRQFFIGALENGYFHVLSKIVDNRSIQIGDSFLYYYRKYSTKGNKARVVGKRDIFIRIAILVGFLTVSQGVRLFEK
jgi:hypothetical protein